MGHLGKIESESISILHETLNRICGLAMLRSVGIDSNVLVWFAKALLFGHVPFPAVNMDTGKKIPEMDAFRDTQRAKWQVDLIIAQCRALDAASAAALSI